MVKEANDQDFNQLTAEGLIMVDFWAPWCAPCRTVAPIMEELQEEMGSACKIIKLNVDENPNVPMEFNVTSIPTILLFKDGQMLDRMVGAGPKEQYKTMIEQHI